MSLAALTLAFSALLPINDAAAGVSCTTTTHDNIGADGASSSGAATNVAGVSSYIYVPNWTTTNLRGQSTTAADVASITDSGSFWQFGWYLGDAGGMPTAGAPQVFVGEGTSASETLTWISYTLPKGDWTGFQLKQDLNSASPTFRHFQAYINSTLVWTSTTTTAVQTLPRFLGETNYDCADMYGLADTSTGGATLKAYKQATGFGLWLEHYTRRGGSPATNTTCWSEARVSGQAATSIVQDLC